MSLEARDRISISGEQTRAPVNGTGEFLIPGVFNDEYYLSVSGLAPGTYLKSATLEGRDVLRNAFIPRAGELSLRLGADGPSLSGNVADAEQHPIGDALVVLLAQDLTDKPPSADLLATRSDAIGRFSFQSLPPGSYRVLALTGIEEPETIDFRLMQQFANQSIEITLEAREKRAVTLGPVDGSRAQ